MNTKRNKARLHKYRQMCATHACMCAFQRFWYNEFLVTILHVIAGCRMNKAKRNDENKRHAQRASRATELPKLPKRATEQNYNINYSRENAKHSGGRAA